MKIAIAGASGNLGSFLSRYLADHSFDLVLFTHSSPLPEDLISKPNVEIRQIDLGNPESLRGCCKDVDCVVSMAGVLFQGRPEKFLPFTNTEYVANLANEAVSAGVRKFILLSFPHVEGETFPDDRAKGVMPEKDPEMIHARTRLEGERRLIRACDRSQMEFLILRCGVVYGEGAKLIEAARKMMRRRLFIIWKKPTWIHLIHIEDLVKLIEVGIVQENVKGILNVADEHPLLLQDFLDRLALYWNFGKPLRFPDWSFSIAAHGFDLFSRISGCSIPLNPDILKMGMTSSVADISRLRNEIGYRFLYPTLNEGIQVC